MARITIFDLDSVALSFPETTEINSELAATIIGGSGIDFTIGKNKWKHPIHVKIDIEIK